MKHLTIIRKKCGRGHIYIDKSTGERIKDKKRILQLKKLGVAPGYPIAYLTENMTEKILAIGVDTKGRSQYMYNSKHTQMAKKEKYQKLYLFGKKLPTIIQHINNELQTHGNKYIPALVLKLISVAYFRIGNQKYAQDNQSYGVTTLLRKHLCFVQKKEKGNEKGKEKEKILISFSGKHGVINSYIITPQKNPYLYSFFLTKKKLKKTERIFPSGTHLEVNNFLSEFGPFSSKNFRTWNASKLCLIYLTQNLIKENKKNKKEFEKKREVKIAIKKTSKKLHHTESICRNSYICPAVIKLYCKHPIIWSRLKKKYGTNYNELLLAVIQYFNKL